MADGLIARLGRDLDAALAAGADRDPARSASGARWLLAWAAICAATGAALFVSGGYEAGFAPANAAAARLPDAVWELLTVLGDERVAFTLSLFFARRHPRVLWALVCAALVATAYSRGLKPLVDAARPPAVLAAGSFHLIGDGHRSHSFPSGHSVTAGVLFGVLVYFARRAGWRLLFLLLATLVGVSRVAVGVHWPVDVAAGLTGGALAALAGPLLARRSPWGIYDGGVHLAFVTLAVFASIGLFYDDGGYRAAALALQVLASVALAVTVGGYLLGPLGAMRAR